jgi:glutamate 5-kinase
MEEVHDRLEREREKRLKRARRIVIKVGTSTVTGPDGGLSRERVEPIVRSIARLMSAGRQVVLVSSGAVGLGRWWLGLHRSRLSDLVTKQACAAIGQSMLMDAYRAFFSAWDIKVAQILLIEEDFSNWRRYLNLRSTIEKLLGFGVLPIVNENDTVSTAELESVRSGIRKGAFSDNDRLAALVASGLEADALVLLTNVDGLLGNWKAAMAVRSENDGESRVIAFVEEISPELKALAAGPSEDGRGGMQSKLEAAEIALRSGATAVIANGQDADTLDRIFSGHRVGTTFLGSSRMKGKRRWIAYAADVRGRIVVDSGAHRAITERKASLLASGVVRIENSFGPLDVVSILDSSGHEFARGIANCSSREAIEGFRKKNPRDAVTNGAGSFVLITRDNIVELGK